MHHPVKEPKHYKGNGKISCMDALDSMLTDAPISPTCIYWWGCALKYLWRWPHKGGKQDVEKCVQCLKYMLNVYEGKVE